MMFAEGGLRTQVHSCFRPSTGAPQHQSLLPSPLRLLLALMVLGGLAAHANAETFRLGNMTEKEREYAHIYAKYKVSDHVIADEQGSDPHGRNDPPGDYKFFIPLPERLAGLTYMGHAARLRLALERARKGDVLRVGALGGSITAGQGVGGSDATYVMMFMVWLNTVMPPRPGAGPVRRLRATRIELDSTHIESDPTQIAAGGGGGGGGVSGSGDAGAGAERDAAGGGRGGGGGGGGGLAGRAARRRRRALHEVGEELVHHQRHACINGAVPGTESAYSSSCLYHHLIPDPDLVFVEYAVNDLPTASWNQAGPSRRAMERLIRKLLSLPSRPAVVLVNMFAIGPSHGKYWYTAERDFSEFATYYGLPSVSLKAAVLPSAAVGGPEQLSPGAIFNGGQNHPGRGGHVVIAELLITLCLELLRSTPRFPGAATATSGATVEGSLVGGPSPSVIGELAAVAARPLPPPMAPGNYETLSKTCYIEEELQSLVQQPLEGWEWTDEGRGKWGYVAVQLRKSLRIKINTRLVVDRSEELAAALIIVQVAHLQSYRGMGTAQVTCVEGCTCKPVTVDAYDPREVSLTMMKDVKVSQHPQCILELTSMGPSRAAVLAASNSTDSGRDGDGEEAGHKFKLMGVVVGEEPGASSGTVGYLRQESHTLWKKKIHE